MQRRTAVVQSARSAGEVLAVRVSAAMPDDVLLSVRDLHTWFELRRWGFVRVGFVRAVDGITFDLRRGEALAVVGGSGCGKGTRAKRILGLHMPTRVAIALDGR